MAAPDNALETLRKITQDFAAFCAKHGAISETDTRANLIDRVLTEVCGWPSGSIRREPHVDSGYIDYCLVVRSRPFVAVEAKKEGAAFVFPQGRHQRSYKLSGAILTEPAIKSAIEQVRGYCVDEGIRYGVATNGYAWIIFRAVREDMPWRSGHAVGFASLEAIAEHFTEFWNLLSYDAIIAGLLDSEFGPQVVIERQLHRPISTVYNADLPLQRNRLHAQLHPFIKTIFEDIAEQHQLEVLQNCYVHSASLKIVASDLDFVITDSIPKFLANEGTREIEQNADDAGAFGRVIEASVVEENGELCLLLGGIGSGKSTFLKRYQRAVGKDVLEKYTLSFSIDFLEAPVSPDELESFVWTTILFQLRHRYQSDRVETRRNIKKAFAVEIAALNETALRHFPPDNQYEKALSPYLAKWQENVNDYVPRLLALCKPQKHTKIVIFIDNVDQLAPAYQAQIFLLSQRVTRRVNAITVVALREESYYAASVQKSFTAYTNHKFHIASPRFLMMIRNRIDYALKLLSQRDQPDLLENSSIPINKDDIADYFKIVESSLFEINRNIVRLIESICFGNMRLALQMFTTFLASGATDVDKMLRIYRRDGRYTVAFHEFLKSIMLGDRQFYKESHSMILNLFDCGIEKNSSHFTAIRLLELLIQHSGESTTEGQGYFEISSAVALFEDTFDNRQDLIRCMNRLVSRQLIEVNTRSTEDVHGASFVRITSSGWYYARILSKSFSYLDLVLQDTPINDKSLATELSNSLWRVNNLADKEEEKIPRTKARFERVEKFLSYLQAEEAREIKDFSLKERGGVFSYPITERFILDLAHQKSWIFSRLEENREKQLEEPTITLTPEDRKFLDGFNADYERMMEEGKEEENSLSGDS